MSHEEIMTSNMEQINQERQMRLRKKLAVAVDCFVNGGKKTKNGKGGMFEFSLKAGQMVVGNEGINTSINVYLTSHCYQSSSKKYE